MVLRGGSRSGEPVGGGSGGGQPERQPLTQRSPAAQAAETGQEWRQQSGLPEVPNGAGRRAAAAADRKPAPDFLPAILDCFERIGLSAEGAHFLHGLSNACFEERLFEIIKGSTLDFRRAAVREEFEPFCLSLRAHLGVKEKDLQLAVQRSLGGGFTWNTLSKAAPAMQRMGGGSEIEDLIERMLQGRTGGTSPSLPPVKERSEEHRILEFLLKTGVAIADLKEVYRWSPDAFVKSVIRAVDKAAAALHPDELSKREVEFEQSIARVLGVIPPSAREILRRQAQRVEAEGAAPDDGGAPAKKDTASPWKLPFQKPLKRAG